MMKEEFEKLIGKNVSNEDYKIIETVYTYHPAISETDGKKEITELFKMGGMRLMKDMVSTAERGKQYEETITTAENALKNLKAEYQRFKEGKE